MRNHVRAFLFLALLVFPISARGQELTSKQILSRWGKAVVSIETARSSGTGFFDENGLLYTAYHVLRGQEVASFTTADGKTGRIRSALMVDAKRDIAVLFAENPIAGPKLGDYAATSAGDRITVIGSPLGFSQTVTEGIISAKRTMDGADHIQMSAGVSPGSSGSPVFNTLGNVVGLVVSTAREGQQLNFAVGSKEFKSGWGVPLGIAFGKASSETPAPLASTTHQPAAALEFGEKAALRGLDGVTVLVETLHDDSKSGGLKEENLQVDAELMLRTSGVPVFPNTEENTGKPYLYIRVSGMRLENTLTFSYGYEVSLKQRVRLARDTTKALTASTWEQSGFGYAGSQSFETAVRRNVRNYVQAFSNDYLAANPKK